MDFKPCTSTIIIVILLISHYFYVLSQTKKKMNWGEFGMLTTKSVFLTIIMASISQYHCIYPKKYTFSNSIKMMLDHLRS